MTTPTHHTPTPAVLLDVALAAARAGAVVVRDAAPRVRTIPWKTKRPADFVSEVDVAAEAAVLRVVRERMPSATVLAEESGALPAHAPAGPASGAASGSVADATGTPGTPYAGTGAHTDRANGHVEFVVDPLDGTTNFLHGYPEFAVSVGVTVDGVPTAGAVIDVALDETFTASLGGGAFANGQRITVSTIDDPGRALIGTGFPFTRPEDVHPYAAGLERVMRSAAGVRRAGAAALDLVAVAAGRFEAFWETRLSPWDIAAGLIIVREAGGVVTDLDGMPCEVRKTGVVAGNPAMHDWLLRQLRNP
ncbi:MAG TPA: inositol monophosphatase family protein [Gemmatimonadaceae bacterium]|nr:inositol monophosphatase family protein [Gemmatimonadaceae bacterium]